MHIFRSILERTALFDKAMDPALFDKAMDPETEWCNKKKAQGQPWSGMGTEWWWWGPGGSEEGEQQGRNR